MATGQAWEDVSLRPTVRIGLRVGLSVGATALFPGLWALVWPQSRGEDLESPGDLKGQRLTTATEVGEPSNTAPSNWASGDTAQ